MTTKKDFGKTDKNAPEIGTDAAKSEQAAREAKDATFPADTAVPAVTTLADTPGPSSGTADGNQAARRLDAADAAGGTLALDADNTADQPDFWLNVFGKNGWKAQKTKNVELADLKAEADEIVTGKNTQALVMNKYGSEVYAGVKIEKPAKEAKAED